MEQTTQTWSVEVQLSERDGTSRAEARLLTGRAPQLVATGEARLSPGDPLDVPEIGFELATARALARLSRQLHQTADDDVETLLREHPARR